MTSTLLVKIVLPLLFILFAFFVGNFLEKRHFANIVSREQALRGFPVLTFEALPADWSVQSATMVDGNIVISLDYFKRIIAGLRAIVGGRVKTYEPLLERARREAILRMVEGARASGHDAVVNVRLETSRLANAAGNGDGTAGVEILAFGTALKLAR